GNLSVTSDEVTLTVLDLTPPANPTVSFNFDDGLLPAGTTNYGNAAISISGGVNNSGVLHLTDAVTNRAGAFVVQPLLGGAELSGFTAAFDVLVGGGSTPPADGFSFDFDPNLPDGTIGAAEDGPDTGLTIGFDFY